MDAVAALVPSIGVALLFWFAVRLMIQADRRERAALAKMDRQDAAAAENGAGQVSPGAENSPAGHSSPRNERTS